MTQIISKFIFTKILGWKLVGNIPEDTRKAVIIGAPHTSWHDFYIAVLFRSYVNRKIKFIGKKSLFKPPFGFIFKWFGGIPIDRTKSSNLVDAIVDVFNSKDDFLLALSPEGTRRKVEKWKTGFYYIAKNASIPIIMLTFDFGRKQVALSKPYFTTDSMEDDFLHFYKFYEGVVGKRPELS